MAKKRVAKRPKNMLTKEEFIKKLQSNPQELKYFGQIFPKIKSEI